MRRSLFHELACGRRDAKLSRLAVPSFNVQLAGPKIKPGATQLAGSVGPQLAQDQGAKLNAELATQRADPQIRLETAQLHPQLAAQNSRLQLRRRERRDPLGARATGLPGNNARDSRAGPPPCGSAPPPSTVARLLDYCSSVVALLINFRIDRAPSSIAFGTPKWAVLLSFKCSVASASSGWRSAFHNEAISRR